MLVHHADAGLDHRARSAGRQRLSEGGHGARVGDVVTEEDVHRRGLAGTVLTEQRQQFAFAQREIDAVIGDEFAETLADAGEFQDGGTAHFGAPAIGN